MSLLSWQEIKDDFRETLVLGNGASMALHREFGYPSLLGKAEDLGLITPRLREVFRYFNNTMDFELVLSRLWYAHHVNRALGVEEGETEQAYRDVRNALIQAVRAIHPPARQSREHLTAMWTFLQRFNTVISLNYDLLVYWAMIEGNDALRATSGEARATWFKDCFQTGGTFDLDWQRFRDSYYTDGATLVFYLHGNLAIGLDRSGYEHKLANLRPSDTLLIRITESWENDETVPLFVSEGESRQKELAILRSPYLSTIYNSVLPSLGSTYVVLGWAVAENDRHVLEKICKPGTRRIAFSVYPPGRTEQELENECDRLRLAVGQFNRDIETVFFDVTSEGCWVTT